MPTLEAPTVSVRWFVVTEAWSVVEIAEALHVGEALIVHAIRRGELRAYRLGGRGTYRVADADLRRWLVACETLPGRDGDTADAEPVALAADR